MSNSKTPGAASEGLSAAEYIGYALGDTASCFFFWTFNIFLTYYYVDVWGIPAASVVTLMLAVRLVDAWTDPVMGIVADRTRTRWGKFRPYLLWMAIPYGICGYLIFANPDIGESGKLPYAYVTYSLMLLAYTAINVPYTALLGVLSPSAPTRAVASSFRFAGATAGGLLVSLFVRPLVKLLGEGDELLGFQQTIGIFAAVSIVLFWISFATTRERVEPPVNQKQDALGELKELWTNRPWLILLVAAVSSTTFIALRFGSILFYFKYVVRDDGAPFVSALGLDFDRATIFISSGMLCQVFGNIVLASVARRVDKRSAAAWLTLVTAVSFSLFFVLPKDNYALLLAVNAIGTFCMGPTSALVFAMYGDVADYGEWKYGRRSTGLVYSGALFSLKTGSTVAGAALPLVLATFGFVKGAAQSAGASLGILLVFSILPGAFALLKALALWWYPLDRTEVQRIGAALAARRLDSEESSGALEPPGSAEAAPA